MHRVEAHRVEAVIHFAANSLVGESMDKPYEYYHNNVFGMMCLLDVMRQNNETIPTNTYGETKLAMEKMMRWFSQAYGIKYVSLRYFNAAGAYESGTIVEAHNPEKPCLKQMIKAYDEYKTSILGRYIINPAIFEILEHTKPGKGEEISKVS